jgi:membrane-associated protease RseP (regulator of RpoE activity)
LKFAGSALGIRHLELYRFFPGSLEFEETSASKEAPLSTSPWEAPPPAASGDRPPLQSLDPTPQAVLVAAGLFGLTCLTTFWCGVENGAGGLQAPWPAQVRAGLSYCVPLMGLLLFHEMGHYVQARLNRVPATLPFFIPAPFNLFGTMGALIMQAAGQANRRVLFDIAVTGPLAGLVIALPVAWWGVQQSTVVQADPRLPQAIFGDPLILKLMVWLHHGPLAENEDVLLNPLLFAGWVGIFLTGLNLAPVGQLDGGHLLYALIGKRAHVVAQAVLLVTVVYMIAAQYWGFALMVLLLTLMGVRHPPTADDHVPLGSGRIILGWLTLALFFVCITPQPFTIREPMG